MKIRLFGEAISFLRSRIPTDIKQTFPGRLGRKRTIRFLSLLGSPQNHLKVIHVAGTSGKGSTAFLTSTLLRSQGMKVGLHLSPHILDIRERMQINNSLISEKRFMEIFRKVFSKLQIMDKGKSTIGKPTYFEILTVMAFLLFYEEKVDYAVIETGVGGWYDATNSVSRKDKICVITRIGLDHTRILGDTVEEIAYQKAKIIEKDNVVITADQFPKAQNVIKKIAQDQKASLYRIAETKTYEVIKISRSATWFSFSFGAVGLKNIKLNLIGRYQASNCSLALTAVKLLSDRDGFKFEENKIRKALLAASFPARFDVIDMKGRTVIIDGAHNPQKMKAFTENLRELFPGSKFIFLLAFKKGKRVKETLRYINPLAQKCIITLLPSTSGLSGMSERWEIIETFLKEMGFLNYELIYDLGTAWRKAKEDNFPIVVTGSLYLCSAIYVILKG